MVYPRKRDERASSLFFFNSGNELVTRINQVVCLGKRGQRLSRLFRINRTLGKARSFRASFALVTLHRVMILTQAYRRKRSTAAYNVHAGKEHENIFDVGGMDFGNLRTRKDIKSKKLRLWLAALFSQVVLPVRSTCKEEAPRPYGLLHGSPARELQSPPTWQPFWLLLSKFWNARIESDPVAGSTKRSFFNPKVQPGSPLIRGTAEACRSRHVRARTQPPKLETNCRRTCRPAA